MTRKNKEEGLYAKLVDRDMAASDSDQLITDYFSKNWLLTACCKWHTEPSPAHFSDIKIRLNFYPLSTDNLGLCDLTVCMNSGPMVY